MGERKIRPHNIDQCINAEFPKPEEDPELYNSIREQMIHEPCGILDRKSPVHVHLRCAQDFPKRLVKETQSCEDPKYKRKVPEDGGLPRKLKERIKNTSLLTTNG
ncbi:hypothetical protein LOD99_8419 [Oopsacas minuta]|uniref:Uncharacterized protein n=1 Tax=Oopsacas minuta TaxID=111878 RepID=A0AAV7JG93_9METZ|nr:hypothetical protein LOD99_8419 [Oopsacas minuta]